MFVIIFLSKKRKRKVILQLAISFSFLVLLSAHNSSFYSQEAWLIKTRIPRSYFCFDLFSNVLLKLVCVLARFTANRDRKNFVVVVFLFVCLFVCF